MSSPTSGSSSSQAEPRTRDISAQPPPKVVIEVEGLRPRTKGNMTGGGKGRKPHDSGKYLRGWTRAIRAAIPAERYQWRERIPVRIEREYRFPRPKNHFLKSGRLSKKGRSEPVPSPGKSDLDKLDRAVYDALEGPILANDGQIVSGDELKRWCKPGESPGATIKLWDACPCGVAIREPGQCTLCQAEVLP